jgi:hypothetical protein
VLGRFVQVFSEDMDLVFWRFGGLTMDRRNALVFEDSKVNVRFKLFALGCSGTICTFINLGKCRK